MSVWSKLRLVQYPFYLLHFYNMKRQKAKDALRWVIQSEKDLEPDLWINNIYPQDILTVYPEGFPQMPI